MNISFLDMSSNYRIMDNIRNSITHAAMIAKEFDLDSKDEGLIKRLVDTRHQQLQRMYSLTFILEDISRKCADQLVRHKGWNCVMSSSMYTVREGSEDYKAMVADCGTDEASYHLTLGSRVDLMVHATIWELKHVIRARACLLNTVETTKVVTKLAVALHGLDPVVFAMSEFEPYCTWQNRGQFRCPETIDGKAKCGGRK